MCGIEAELSGAQSKMISRRKIIQSQKSAFEIDHHLSEFELEAEEREEREQGDFLHRIDDHQLVNGNKWRSRNQTTRNNNNKSNCPDHQHQIKPNSKQHRQSQPEQNHQSISASNSNPNPAKNANKMPQARDGPLVPVSSRMSSTNQKGALSRNKQAMLHQNPHPHQSLARAADHESNMSQHFDPYSVYGEEEDEEEDVWYSEERLFEVSAL